MNWVKKTEEFEVCKDCGKEDRDEKLMRCSYCNLRVCYCEGFFQIDVQNVSRHAQRWIAAVCNKCAHDKMGLEAPGRGIITVLGRP